MGWLELPDGVVFFALNIDMPGGLADAPKRKRLVRASLQVIGTPAPAAAP